jgi:hypothetical protein
VPSDVSGASDQQRLQYAMQVLEGFKESSPFFSDTSYQSWMGHINPLVQAYEPAKEVFPLWKSTAEMPTTRYGGGPDDAYTYEEPAGVNYSQWEDIAKQLGYTEPVYGTVGYDIEGGGITGIDPQFKSFVDQKRAEGYDFVQYQPDLRNYRQKYGFRLPDGQVVGEYYGEGRDADVVSLFKDFVLPVATTIMGIPGYGGSVAQSIGSAILPAEAATALSGALNLAPEVITSAVGRGIINAGIQGALGGDVEDVLRAGALPLAAPVVSQGIGQAVGAVAPPDFDPVLGQVSQPITDAVQRAITTGALTGLSGGDALDAAQQTLLNNAAKAAGAEVGLSPQTSQGVLNLIQSGGDVNPVEAFKTATGVLGAIKSQPADIRAELEDVVGSGGDVDVGDFDAGMPVDTSVEQPLLTDEALMPSTDQAGTASPEASAETGLTQEEIQEALAGLAAKDEFSEPYLTADPSDVDNEPYLTADQDGSTSAVEGDYGQSVFDKWDEWNQTLEDLEGKPGAIAAGGADQGVVTSTGQIVDQSGNTIAAPAPSPATSASTSSSSAPAPSPAAATYRPPTATTQATTQATTPMDYRATFLAPFIVGGEAAKAFQSALAPFLKEAMTPDFMPSRVPTAAPRPEQAAIPMMPQNPLDLYQPERDFEGLYGFAMGGPAFAQGGTRHGENAHGALRVLEHSGKHRVDYRQGDAVTGIGDGQSDDIPAMLADGEFVIPADVVSALGNGSTKAGSDKLYDMMHSIRRHHRSAGPKDLPPPAKKSPLDYITKRRSSR